MTMMANMKEPTPMTTAVKYTTDYRHRVAETPDYCITEYKVRPGQQSPWHSHTATTDLFYVLHGRLDIWLAAPDEVVPLRAGQSLQVASGRVHRFTAGEAGEEGEAGGAHYLLIQGVGKPDFIAVAPPAPGG